VERIEHGLLRRPEADCVRDGPVEGGGEVGIAHRLADRDQRRVRVERLAEIASTRPGREPKCWWSVARDTPARAATCSTVASWNDSRRRSRTAATTRWRLRDEAPRSRVRTLWRAARHHRRRRVGAALVVQCPGGGFDRALFNRPVGLGVVEPAARADVVAIAAGFQAAGVGRSMLVSQPQCRPDA
jgi:hypothetical protein